MMLEVHRAEEREHDMGRGAQRDDRGGGEEEAERCADADRNGDRRGDEHTEEHRNVAGERERHRAEHDAGHKHGHYDADGAQNACQHHMI